MKNKQALAVRSQVQLQVSSLGCEHFDAVLVEPRSLLFFGSVVYRFRALDGQDVEVGGVGTTVG